MTRRLRILGQAGLLAGTVGLAACGTTGSLPAVIDWRPTYKTFDGKFIDQPGLPAASQEAQARAGAVKGLVGPELFESYGLVQAPELQKYLESLVAQSLKSVPNARLPNAVLIDASNVPRAFSNPHGDIFVTLGLIDALETESQMAAVLAHEAGHLQLDHFSRDEYFQAQRALVSTGAGLGVVGLAALATRARRSGDTIQFYSVDQQDTAQKSMEIVAASWIVTTVSDDVLNTNWGRQQESEADLFAIDVTTRAGFDPRGTADMLHRVGEIVAEQEGLAAVLQREAERVQQELLATGDPLAAVQVLPAKALQVVGNTARAGWAKLRDTHPSPASRQEWANAYVEREYGEVRLGRQQRAKDATRYVEQRTKLLPPSITRGHGAAQQAFDLLARGRLPEAEQQIAVALNSQVANSAHVRTIAYMVAKARRKDDMALHHLESIDPRELKPNPTFEFLVAEYIRKQNWRKATATIEEAETQFGTTDPYLPMRIHVAVARQDAVTARQTHERCRQVTSQEIRVACDQAIDPLHLADVSPAEPAGPLGDLGDSIKGIWGKINDQLGI